MCSLRVLSEPYPLLYLPCLGDTGIYLIAKNMSIQPFKIGDKTCERAQKHPIDPQLQMEWNTFKIHLE